MPLLLLTGTHGVGERWRWRRDQRQASEPVPPRQDVRAAAMSASLGCCLIHIHVSTPFSTSSISIPRTRRVRARVCEWCSARARTSLVSPKPHRDPSRRCLLTVSHVLTWSWYQSATSRLNPPPSFSAHPRPRSAFKASRGKGLRLLGDPLGARGSSGMSQSSSGGNLQAD